MIHEVLNHQTDYWRCYSFNIGPRSFLSYLVIENILEDMLKDNDGVKTNGQADVAVGYWQLDRRKRRSNNLSSQCMNSNDGP
ncbi:hypothetical protein NC653_032570 [Populus alba x Populus x berolinensis]|uniref:Uncharacterized protein n=1 Tax=Populus alba x Populus x berolinensis TaxID=444605 RepID=A0AAD6LS13_9ROSI|nr:hypothetical protein NC653_032570 [Populus alba x Populus x berolinensis]